jgi:hypothetical protein
MRTWRVTSSEIVIALSALVLLLAAQWTLSAAILATNYFGNDGKMLQSLVLTAFKFGGYLDVTNLSPIQGVGSQLLPKNVWANPAFWPFAFFAKETATDISALIALAIFASTVYIMMRCFDVAILPSALTAQACIALFAPAVLIVRTPASFCLTPGDAVVYAPYMIALGLLARLEQDSWRSFGVTAGGISGLVFYSIYCDPLWTMIGAISWAVPFAVVTLSPLQPKAIMMRGAAIGCCLGLLLLSGAASYLYTLSQYTARVQFAETLDRVRAPEYVSAMTYSPNMKYFYIACTLGWLLGLVTLRGRASVLVVAAVTAFAVWAFYGLIYLLVLNTTWVPPIPIYLEQCLFALYLAGAAAGCWGSLSAVAVLVARSVPPLRRVGAVFGPPIFAPLSAQPVRKTTPQASRLQSIGATLAFLCVAIIPANIINYAYTDAQAKAKIFYLPWVNDPELIQLLTKNIGLAVGQPFRGAVNFLTIDLVTAFTIDTLSSRGVPTLNEYSQLVTPEALYFVHKLLKRDVRGQLNQFDMFWSKGSYSPVYWKALEMFGVRYSAERRALPDEFNPGLLLTKKPHPPYAPDDGSDTWYIYELPRPNVGDYSPTEIVTARSGADIMAILGQPDFDVTRQVVLSAPLDLRLVPARDMRLSVIRGGWHVSGKSTGISLVVLPQQFSHCLRPRDKRVRFVRANLMMAGIVFYGDIDTDIVFDYAILSPACRRADLADIKQLDLRIDLRMQHLTGDRLFPDWAVTVTRLRAAADAINTESLKL